MKRDRTPRCVWLALIALLGFPAVGRVEEKPAPANRPDDWPKLRTRGGEVYLLDASLRDVFARDHAKALAENGRKLPDVSAPAFDWSTLVTPPRVVKQRHPICFAFSTLSTLEVELGCSQRRGGAATFRSTDTRQKRRR
jgi:hypothetical protein